ncbi:MAG TPA: hypothetical protein VGD81_17685 [Opitutaceae bacterium]
MKTERLTFALIGGGVVAAAWALSNVRSEVSFDAILGYGTVLAIVALGAIDYRFRAKRASANR